MISPSSTTLGKFPNSMYRPCTSSGGGEVGVAGFSKNQSHKKRPKKNFSFFMTALFRLDTKFNIEKREN